MTWQDRYAEGPDNLQHQETSTDHLIDVLRRLRNKVRYLAAIDGFVAESVSEVVREANKILKTYGHS